MPIANSRIIWYNTLERRCGNDFYIRGAEKRIEPVAVKYDLKAVYIFGSYARNEAADDSDVDILIDRTGSKIKGMLDMGGLYNDFRESIGKNVDILTTHTLEQNSTKRRVPVFVETVNNERVKIF